jgi:hypothetical protein
MCCVCKLAECRMLTVAGTAALDKPTLQSLRSFQHSDADGNLIGESTTRVHRTSTERPQSIH